MLPPSHALLPTSGPARGGHYRIPALPKNACRGSGHFPRPRDRGLVSNPAPEINRIRNFPAFFSFIFKPVSPVFFYSLAIRTLSVPSRWLECPRMIVNCDINFFLFYCFDLQGIRQEAQMQH